MRFQSLRDGIATRSVTVTTVRRVLFASSCRELVESQRRASVGVLHNSLVGPCLAPPCLGVLPYSIHGNANCLTLEKARLLFKDGRRTLEQTDLCNVQDTTALEPQLDRQTDARVLAWREKARVRRSRPTEGWGAVELSGILVAGGILASAAFMQNSRHRVFLKNGRAGVLRLVLEWPSVSRVGCLARADRSILQRRVSIMQVWKENPRLPGESHQGKRADLFLLLLWRCFSS